MEEKLSRSQEDYLEEICNQVIKRGYAKVTDIAEALNVKKASVTGALNVLAAIKLINYEPYAKITLTDEGEVFAKNIIEKHENLRDFFENILGLSSLEASENACRMEHVVSEEFFINFVKFSNFIREYSVKNPEFLKSYRNMLK